MPIDITLDQLPAGFAAGYAAPGEQVPICIREFVTSSQGHHFIRRVEGAVDPIIAAIQAQTGKLVVASVVDHLVAIIRRDKSATVYINELPIQIEVRALQPFEKGDAVALADLADFRRLRFEGLTIPPSAGVIVLFSQGWRKGLFFDFQPLGGTEDRTDDMEQLLGEHYGLVAFQERFSLADDEWDAITREQWFPFIGFSYDLLDKMIRVVRSKESVDSMLQEFADDFALRHQQMVDVIKRHPVCGQHSQLVERGIERHLAGDYISSTSILYPQVEGIMRAQVRALAANLPTTQAGMARAAVLLQNNRLTSLLHPQRFDAYLRQVYFAAFDPTNPHILVSRNSVAHGVAAPAEYAMKASLVAIHIIHHLCFTTT